MLAVLVNNSRNSKYHDASHYTPTRATTTLAIATTKMMTKTKPTMATTTFVALETAPAKVVYTRTQKGFDKDDEKEVVLNAFVDVLSLFALP